MAEERGNEEWKRAGIKREERGERERASEQKAKNTPAGNEFVKKGEK